MIDSFKGRIAIDIDGKYYFLRADKPIKRGMPSLHLEPATEYNPVLPSDIKFVGKEDENGILRFGPINDKNKRCILKRE